MTIATIVLLTANILSVFVARNLALQQSKAPLPWMWAAALFGPLPLLILAALSGKQA